MASMPTSATGNRRLRGDAGVTLIESMMALMVVSLMAGAVMLATSGRDHVARVEAERLAARMTLAGEEGVIANRTIALVVTSEGYGFERFEDGRWLAADLGSPLAFRAWPEGVVAQVEEAELDGEGGRVASFDALGAATPVAVVLSKNGVQWRAAVSPEGRVDVTRGE